MSEIRRVALDPSQVEPGSTLRPIARFAMLRDSVEQASVVLGRAEIFAREPGSDVFVPIHAEAVATTRLAAASRRHAFTLFQDKEAFWWRDAGQALPESVGPSLDRVDALVDGGHAPLRGGSGRSSLAQVAVPRDLPGWPPRPQRRTMAA